MVIQFAGLFILMGITLIFSLQKIKPKYLKILILLIVIYSSFQDIGFDIKIYRDEYLKLQTNINSKNLFSHNYEPIFLLMSVYLKKLNISFNYYMVFCNILIYLPIYIYIRKKSNPYLYLFFFLSFNGLMGSLNIIRQTISNSLFLYILYLDKKNIKKSIYFGVIPLFMHYSSILLIPYIYISKKTLLIKKWFFIIIGIIFLSLILKSILLDIAIPNNNLRKIFLKLNYYIKINQNVEMRTYFYYLYQIIFSLFLINYKKKFNKIKENRLIVNLSLLGIFSFLFCYILGIKVIGARLNLLCSFYNFILAGNKYSCLKSQEKKYFIFSSYILIFIYHFILIKFMYWR